ncbi:MAG: OsmC family protein [Clostridia bacterium]|nr:OsmC family protein [Clostridia bacterium]
MENIVVKVKRTDSKVHFEAVSDSNPSMQIPFDYAPPLGSGCGFAGLEVLLMSFAGCVSTTTAFLLGRLGKHISAYTATAEGVRTEHPLSLKENSFHICVKSDDVTDTDMEKVIRQAEAVSPVWQAVKNNIIVKTTYEISL